MLSFFILLILACYIVCKYAESRFNRVMHEGSRRTSPGGQTAAEAARAFLDDQGCESVQIREHTGLITNYYDPSRKTLFLSRDILNRNDLGAWCLVLHEAAHATQVGDAATAYRWRLQTIRLNRYLPFITSLTLLLLILIQRSPIHVAIRIFAIVLALLTLLNVLSLPIEFNASQRALTWLEKQFERNLDCVDLSAQLLKGIALRDTKTLLQSPRYCLTSLLPGSSYLRPRK